MYSTSWEQSNRKCSQYLKSRIQKSFACGIQNPENICSWNPESWKYLLMESGTGIQKTFAHWIRKIFAHGIRNPTLWNLEPRSRTRIPESIIFGVRNPQRWNHESSIPGMRSPHNESGIQDCRRLPYKGRFMLLWTKISQSICLCYLKVLLHLASRFIHRMTTH